MTEVKCAYCGAEDGSVEYHSGVQECRRCWNYRKLDEPAASHWAKVAKAFLSNVDMYDLTQYMPRVVGLEQSELTAVLTGARRIELVSRYLNDNGPRHTWSDEVEAHLENEMRARGVL